MGNLLFCQDLIISLFQLECLHSSSSRNGETRSFLFWFVSDSPTTPSLAPSLSISFLSPTSTTEWILDDYRAKDEFNDDDEFFLSTSAFPSPSSQNSNPLQQSLVCFVQKQGAKGFLELMEEEREEERGEGSGSGSGGNRSPVSLGDSRRFNCPPCPVFNWKASQQEIPDVVFAQQMGAVGFLGMTGFSFFFLFGKKWGCGANNLIIIRKILLISFCFFRIFSFLSNLLSSHHPITGTETKARPTSPEDKRFSPPASPGFGKKKNK